MSNETEHTQVPTESENKLQIMMLALGIIRTHNKPSNTKERLQIFCGIIAAAQQTIRTPRRPHLHPSPAQFP